MMRLKEKSKEDKTALLINPSLSEHQIDVGHYLSRMSLQGDRQS